MEVQFPENTLPVFSQLKNLVEKSLQETTQLMRNISATVSANLSTIWNARECLPLNYRNDLQDMGKISDQATPLNELKPGCTYLLYREDRDHLFGHTEIVFVIENENDRKDHVVLMFEYDYRSEEGKRFISMHENMMAYGEKSIEISCYQILNGQKMYSEMTALLESPVNETAYLAEKIKYDPLHFNCAHFTTNCVLGDSIKGTPIQLDSKQHISTVTTATHLHHLFQIVTRRMGQDLEQCMPWMNKERYNQEMYNMGLHYNESNKNEAAQYFKLAADGGHADSQNRLGVMHNNGCIKNADINTAAKLFSRAAENGHPVAQFNLARMYKTGNGKPQNIERAIHWYQRSAAQGCHRAQDELNEIIGESNSSSDIFDEI